jgi:hypothetical protein
LWCLLLGLLTHHLHSVWAKRLHGLLHGGLLPLRIYLLFRLDQTIGHKTKGYSSTVKVVSYINKLGQHLGTQALDRTLYEYVQPLQVMPAPKSLDTRDDHGVYDVLGDTRQASLLRHPVHDKCDQGELELGGQKAIGS